MAWSDEPTDKQINAAINLIKWQISREEMPKIDAYLKKHATRRELSNELGRLRDLRIHNRMNREVAFAGDIWSEYEH